MKVDLNEVMRFVDSEGAITLSQLCKAFGVDYKQGRRILVVLMEKEKLTWCPGLPRQAVFFTNSSRIGTNAFGIVIRQKQGSDGETAKERWYKKHLAALRELIQLNPERGLIIADVMTGLDTSRKIARTSLDLLVDKGELMRGQASSGGAYGRPPYIWGVDEFAIEAREMDYIEEAEKRKEVRS